MRRYLPVIIVGAVALLTLGSAAMLYRAKRLPVLTSKNNQAASGMDATGPMHVLGPLSAPVTIEEFGDFECPPCGVLSEPINQLEHQSRLCVIFRQFPLSIHQHAHEAALASEAAGLQGRFWQMHDVLYREQETWSKAPNVRELFESYAGTIGLDVDKFKKDMDGEQVKARVEADRQRGQSLGIQITPTLFINNQPLDPKDKNPEGIRAEINAALEKKTQT